MPRLSVARRLALTLSTILLAAGLASCVATPNQPSADASVSSVTDSNGQYATYDDGVRGFQFAYPSGRKVQAAQSGALVSANNATNEQYGIVVVKNQTLTKPDLGGDCDDPVAARVAGADGWKIVCAGGGPWAAGRASPTCSSMAATCISYRASWERAPTMPTGSTSWRISCSRGSDQHAGLYV